LKEVIDSSPYAAALIDAGGRHLSLNRRFTEVFGYTLEDVPTGKEWFNKAFPDEQKRKEAIAAWKADMGRACRGEARPRTFTVQCRDGGEKAVLFRPVELCDGTQYITCEDVTGERRACQVLAEEIAELRQHLPSQPGA
jgi:PAS domain S-box-containing protein